jgi:hypothetical protein
MRRLQFMAAIAAALIFAANGDAVAKTRGKVHATSHAGVTTQYGDAQGRQWQPWRTASGMQISIPRPRNHKECMTNGVVLLHYSVQETHKHCDSRFRR